MKIWCSAKYGKFTVFLCLSFSRTSTNKSPTCKYHALLQVIHSEKSKVNKMCLCLKIVDLMFDLDVDRWPWPWYQRKGLTTRNTHVKFQIWKLYHLPFKKLWQMLMFFLDKRINGQGNGQTERANLICTPIYRCRGIKRGVVFAKKHYLPWWHRLRPSYLTLTDDLDTKEKKYKCEIWKIYHLYFKSYCQSFIFLFSFFFFIHPWPWQMTLTPKKKCCHKEYRCEIWKGYHLHSNVIANVKVFFFSFLNVT